MTEWVALLRGVNVGGISITSAPLAAVFAGLGFSDTKTVLASGNVRFRSQLSERAELKAAIERALRDAFGYDAWIVLITMEELRAAADAFPFDHTVAERQPWVIFCVDDATKRELLAEASAIDSALDPVAEGARAVYWWPAKGSSTDTPFAKVLARATYKPRTTNRNLRTLRKIIGSTAIE